MPIRKALWKVSYKAFRISKGNLETRPKFHFTEKRIKVHVCPDFTTAPDETEHHSQLKGRWAFTNPSQATLLIGHEHDWNIEKLNKQLFAFYDRMGELGDLSMTREYVELKPRRQASN
ncbi:hypothetical protein EVA_22088 [gut metagenome]|uniref:Uncharacterized protein n=1 Tax=gut metagenome TaxID=749906 RepID=J9F5L7_9ZZZZ